MDWNRWHKIVQRELKERFEEAKGKLGLPGRISIEMKEHHSKDPAWMGFIVKCGDRKGEVCVQWHADTNKGDTHRIRTLPEEAYKPGDYIRHRYELFLSQMFGQEGAKSNREKDILAKTMERAGVDLEEATKHGSASGENISVD